MPASSSLKTTSSVRSKRPSALYLQSLIEEFASSPLTALAFCKSKNIPPSTFYKWRKELEKSAPHKPSQSFVPVTLDEGEISPSKSSSSPPADFMLHFNEGLSLSISQGFHGPTL